jgi:hypothetical protein
MRRVGQADMLKSISAFLLIWLLTSLKQSSRKNSQSLHPYWQRHSVLQNLCCQWRFGTKNLSTMQFSYRLTVLGFLVCGHVIESYSSKIILSLLFRYITNIRLLIIVLIQRDNEFSFSDVRIQSPPSDILGFHGHFLRYGKRSVSC